MTAANFRDSRSAWEPADDEPVFFRHRLALVTLHRFRVEHRTYALSTVFAADSRTIRARRAGAVLSAVASAAALATALAWRAQVASGNHWLGELPMAAHGLLVAAVAMLGGSVFWFLRAKHTHAIYLRTTSGESVAFTSFDRRLVAEITGAVQKALEARSAASDRAAA